MTGIIADFSETCKNPHVIGGKIFGHLGPYLQETQGYSLHPQKNAILAFQEVKQFKVGLKLYKNILRFMRQNKYR